MTKEREYCWFFHDWTKWTSPIKRISTVQNVIYSYGVRIPLGSPYQVQETVQTRYCKRCWKHQERLV